MIYGLRLMSIVKCYLFSSIPFTLHLMPLGHPLFKMVFQPRGGNNEEIYYTCGYFGFRFTDKQRPCQ